jgi:hypothetical protein
MMPADTVELRRACVNIHCSADARPGGKQCREHHATVMKRWRADRRVAGKSTAGAASTAPSSASGVVNARVALHRAIKSGTISRGPCATCATRERVIGVRIGSDAADVIWACRAHRHEILRDRAERLAEEGRVAKERAAAIGAAEAAIARRQSALDRLAAAPASVVAALQAEAAAFRGLRLSPESPLFRQRLAQIAEARLSPEAC